MIFSFFPSVHFINEKIVMSPQSHMKNNIWQPNLISKYIFLSTFIENNAIQFTPFWSCFINLSIPKRERFIFVIISFKALETHIIQYSLRSILCTSKVNNYYEFFVFSKCSLYQRKTFMTSP